MKLIRYRYKTKFFESTLPRVSLLWSGLSILIFSLVLIGACSSPSTSTPIPTSTNNTGNYSSFRDKHSESSFEQKVHSKFYQNTPIRRITSTTILEMSTNPDHIKKGNAVTKNQ